MPTPRARRVRRSFPVLLVIASAAGAFAATSDRPHSGVDANASAVADPFQWRFGAPELRPRTDGAVRLAAFNVLNLFDDRDDPALEGEWDDIDEVTDPKRLEALAEAFRRTDADIVALQEVESREALEWFRDRYLTGMGYDHVASIDVGYYRGVECSILSRFPIERAWTWTGADLDDVEREGPGFTAVPPEGREGQTYQRSPLLAEIRVSEGYRLTVASIHHKSGRDFGWKREAEALGTVARITEYIEQHPDANVVLMGDFNAAPWDKSLRLYLEAGFVDVHAQRSTRGRRDEPDAEGDLWKTHESARVIDFILMNDEAYNEVIPGTAHVVALRWFPEYDWRNDPEPEGYASDHRPVVVEIVPRESGGR